MINTNNFFSQKKENDGYFIAFHQLVQKLQWIKQIIYISQNKQNLRQIQKLSSLG